MNDVDDFNLLISLFVFLFKDANGLNNVNWIFTNLFLIDLKKFMILYNAFNVLKPQRKTECLYQAV